MIRKIFIFTRFLITSLIVLAFLIFSKIRRSLRPIALLDQTAIELSKGNLRAVIEFQSDDELGSLAQSLRSSIAILHSYISDIDRVMGEMADGNFDTELSQPFIGDFKNIQTSVERFVADISVTLEQVAVAAGQVSAGAEQVSSGAQELSQSATQQAGSVEELSSEIVEVSAHIKNNAASAAAADQMAMEVGGRLGLSNEQMMEMTAAMHEISSQSMQIGKIIKTIEDIAFQTNILALNAAVEAARAGAAGKGFAVVADEVRNLATKSSLAAKQTNELIDASIQSVQRGVEIADATAKSLGDVVTGASEITKIIAEISHSSAEQSNSMDQIRLGVGQISASVQTNSATSEESSAASEELNGQAALMRRLTGRFRLKKNN